MSFVRTVLGDIPAAELGPCYAHEHVYIGPSFATAQFPDFRIDDVDKQSDELIAFHRDGGRAMVDSMPCDAGRDVLRLAEISRRSGVHIVCPTGLHLAKYYHPGHWGNRYSEEQLAGLFIADVEDGVDAHDYGGPIVRRTPHCAGVIKVATDRAWTDRERRVFVAAARAHRETGCPILTHTEAGLLGLEQAVALRELGVCLERVCLSHTDRRPDPVYHREMLSTGVRVEYDGAFRWRSGEGNPTLDLVAGLIGEFPDQIMLGMDAARRGYWRCHGGSPGLSYLMTDFSARLRASGVTEDALHRIFVTTPASTFSFAPRQTAAIEKS